MHFLDDEELHMIFIYLSAVIHGKYLLQNYNNKTKDWALVQTAALVINKGVEVRLTLVR